MPIAQFSCLPSNRPPCLRLTFIMEGTQPAPTPSTARQALIFIVAVTVVRLLWHLLHPVGMAGDETYYWLWGQYPEWGYFSKPPLIGWLYGALAAAFGNLTWGYKATATLFAAGSLWFFFQFMRRLTGHDQLALLGVIALAFLPANLLLGSILTIDAPLMFFWMGALYCTSRILLDEQPSKRLYLGLWFMLACGHLAKQMMLIQLALILVLCICYRRDQLLRPALWIALAGSLISLVPALYWNAQNEWITLAHTAHHFEPGKINLGDSLGRLGELWGALAGLISPVLFVLAFPAIGYAWKARRDPRVILCVLYGVAGLIIMSSMTIRQRVNPNWPAVFLYGSLALILLWATASEQRQRWLTRGIRVAIVMSLALMILLPLLGPLAGPLAKIGLQPQRRGWLGYPQLVEQTMQLAPEAQQLVFVGHRFTASQFAYHGPDPKRVYLWNPTDHFRSQFDFFPAPQTGVPTLIVVEQKKDGWASEIPAELRQRLGSLEPLTDLPMHPVREYPRFHIYLASELNSWNTIGTSD